MGWCSGTSIFDDVVEELIRLKEKDQISTNVRDRIAKVLLDAMEDHDWDCQGDSDHLDVPWVRTLLGYDDIYD